jgi:EmrB/QacA subfamily drug resistance transporter
MLRCGTQCAAPRREGSDPIMPPAPSAPAGDDVPATVANPRLRLLIPLVVAFGFLMEQLDSTIITTAIPQMAHSLHETPVRLSVAITSYVLSLAVFIPISGWIADRLGARTVICAAFAVFTIASAICGLATNLPVLVLMRIVQGMGGAMMTPVGRLILLRSFPKKDLVTAMAYVSVPSMVGPTLGPILGGLLTTYASWRWIFYVNIPFGILAILVSWRAVANVKGGGPPGRFDTVGFVICGLGLALLQLVLETVGRGAIPVPLEIGLFTAAVVTLLVYRWHASRTKNPVLDLTLFRIRTFRIGSLAGGLSRIGINAPPFLLPLLLQIGFGMSPIQSGTLTFATSFGAVAIRTVSARLLRKFGFSRVLLGNSVVCTLYIAGFTLLAPTTPHWMIFLYIAGFGVVRGTQFNACQMLSYAEMPPAMLSRSTSLGSVVQQLSMGFGVSFSAALLGVLVPPGHLPSVLEFHYAFLAIALLPLIAMPGFLGLTPEDGAEVSGHRPHGMPRPAHGD